MRHRRLVALVALPLALGACSQVAALTPVSGGPVTSVRNAVYDVLVEQQVPILVAPQCVAVTTGFSCSGTTQDGQEILANATSAAFCRTSFALPSKIVAPPTVMVRE